MTEVRLKVEHLGQVDSFRGISSLDSLSSTAGDVFQEFLPEKEPGDLSFKNPF